MLFLVLHLSSLGIKSFDQHVIGVNCFQQLKIGVKHSNKMKRKDS